VANAPKSAGTDHPAKPNGLQFEEALKRLESIVESMESEDLPLETLLAKYEEGTQLAKLCQERLGDAELKILQLEKSGPGQISLKPLAQSPLEE
jgi:exodeoxyribonuclease VII small subunit